MINKYNQAGTNYRVHHVPRGKLLGGSSGINYMAYCRPAAQDIDLWENLGNKGWSWAELQPCYLRSESIDESGQGKPAQKSDIYNIHPDSHGHLGPVKTSFPYRREPYEDRMIDAFDEISGVSRPDDPWNGAPLGQYGRLSTVDREHGPSRSYSASAFLAPNLRRENLKILEYATACKIMLDVATLTAYGVELLCAGGTYQVFANEIILSAGSIGSPQILELSGIGDPEILSNNAIECVLALPEVGKNLQEHPMTSLTYALDMSRSPHSDLHLSNEYQECETSDGESLMAFLPYPGLVSPAELSETISQIRDYTWLAEPERESIISRLQDPSSGDVQFNGTAMYIDIESGHGNQSKLVRNVSGDKYTYYTYLVTITNTMSRGSTHIKSADPRMAPSIDLGLLNAPTDVDLLAAGLQFVDRVFSSKHISDQVVERVVPRPGIDLGDRKQARQFVRNWTTSFNHALGTCSMGRVVDERLRVKGCHRLRVVDASVIPTMISGNVMATVYAVAEKASDILKEDLDSSRVG